MQIVDLMRRWDHPGKTIVIATHDLHLLEEIADECVVMHEGRVVGRGAPAAVLADEKLLTQANLLRPRYSLSSPL
jgi:energy-coupling factor transporter ATP-binding protein EcfA2